MSQARIGDPASILLALDTVRAPLRIDIIFCRDQDCTDTVCEMLFISSDSLPQLSPSFYAVLVENIRVHLFRRHGRGNRPCKWPTMPEPSHHELDGKEGLGDLNMEEMGSHAVVKVKEASHYCIKTHAKEVATLINFHSKKYL